MIKQKLLNLINSDIRKDEFKLKLLSSNILLGIYEEYLIIRIKLLSNSFTQVGANYIWFG